MSLGIPAAIHRRVKFTGTANLLVSEGATRSDIMSLARRAIEYGDAGLCWYGRTDTPLLPGAHMGVITVSASDRSTVIIRLKQLGIEVNAPDRAINVAIIVETVDDIRALADAILFFDSFSVKYSIAVMSPKYSAARINAFASELAEKGTALIIAVSSHSFQLASVLSSLCVLPVIALCLSRENSAAMCKSDDATFSIVASTRGIDAALFAVKLLSISSEFNHFQNMLSAYIQEKEQELVRETLSLNETRLDEILGRIK